MLKHIWWSDHDLQQQCPQCPLVCIRMLEGICGIWEETWSLPNQMPPTYPRELVIKRHLKRWDARELGCQYLAFYVQFSKIKLHKCKIPRNCVCVKRLLISSSQMPQNSNHERLVCQTLDEQLRTTKKEKRMKPSWIQSFTTE